VCPDWEFPLQMLSLKHPQKWDISLTFNGIFYFVPLSAKARTHFPGIVNVCSQPVFITEMFSFAVARP
jgi:hypothetical protein